MESEIASKLYEVNPDDLSPQTLQNTKKDSQTLSFKKHKHNFQDENNDEGEKASCVQNRSKTRTWNSNPDRDCMSDKEEDRSSGSFYSEDYENESPERSVSPYSQSQTPYPTPQRRVQAKRVSSSPIYKTGGVGHRPVRPQRPGGPRLTQHRRGVQSQNKESSLPKDLDLVTKRMLSARLLKISELRNALSELQQRIDELQKENRILRQLQVRQEKALQRYDDTESEISQLLSRHANEMHVLRERHRRSQERERAAERRLKDSEEQLQKSQATIARLKKLVDQRELGTRDELSRRLEEEKTRVQETERKIKELGRSLELSNISYQRQLVAERKKNVSARDEIRTLQEELERLTIKLREKERELDAKNIYANRMVKSSLRKNTDGYADCKAPSRNSNKAVQTEDRMSSLDFPTPPPAITDAPEYNDQPPDEYLSLRKLGRVDRRTETEDRHQSWEQQKIKERGRERESSKEQKQEKEEKQQLYHELNVLEDKAKRLRDGWEKEMGEENKKKTSSLSNQKEEEIMKKHGHVQEEVERWNQAALANQHLAEEAWRKKEQLLAKMLEIDRQNQGAQDFMYAESSLSESNKGTSPRPSELRKHNASVFSLTEPEGSTSCRTGAGSGEGGRRRPGIEGGAVTTGIGRRALRNHITSDDLAFGNYAPSFGHSSSLGTSGFPPTPLKEYRDSAVETMGALSLRGLEMEQEMDAEKGGGKDRKSSLMQQLFGALAMPAGESVNVSNKMETLNSPPITNGIRSGRDGLFSFKSGSSTPPTSSLNTLHVADSRPAVRAIPSFDDDIEELAL
ncbi:Lebercilin Leber congenital amaurosis 5 protein [Channa argus]|uniref:Lebercilin Leber congenital amaurosis 5 protein n=1 Tax=Channa argus TaxID=215402 RepID=A0A6G1QJZ2_CHAAH|nr:Lebercilin Leber congenital amaurosis 5 protein [Channa argus]KAK2890226.1 hypothetical protein Q8A73_018526 [Channa argus]